MPAVVGDLELDFMHWLQVHQHGLVLYDTIMPGKFIPCYFVTSICVMV